MPAIIDHIGAVIIGAAVIFLIATLQIRTQDTSIGATQVDAAKTGLRLLVDMVEQDVTNMGSGMERPNATEPDAVITDFGAKSMNGETYTVLEFQGLPSRSGAPDPLSITYRWREDGEIQLDDGTFIDTYRVERLIDGTLQGSSFNNLTRFEINLLDADRNQLSMGATDYRTARYVTANITMISPLGADDILEETRWAKQFRPINLDPSGRTRLRVVMPTS